MAEEIDGFVINYALQRLQKQWETERDIAIQYRTQNDKDVEGISKRVEVLEDSEQTNVGTINSIVKLINGLTTKLDETVSELNKTKIINLKQEIVVRTLHNLKVFDAYDMYADTFADGLAIDWTASVRAELLTEYQAVGKTRKSIISAQQTKVPSYMLISKNGTSDEAVSQLFQIDKNRELDKVSVFVEAFSDNTYKPLVISIKESLNGVTLTSIDIPAGEAIGGWVDLEIPAYVLSGSKDYYLEIRTADIYGYKIGMDTTDRYLSGTSYSFFNGVWTDNNHDVGFKIWCFPSTDENDAIILTVPRTIPTTPQSIIFEREETTVNGGIIYYVSRNGLDWKLLQPGIETDLNDLPTGNKIILKAVITGDSRIEAWGYVIKRSETA